MTKEKEQIYIKIHPKTNRYQYLWLKYIYGFNPKTHCAHCLIGNYSQIIPYRKIPANTILEGFMNEVSYNFVGYLCGVSNRYEDNLHIAFKYSKGGVIEYDTKLVKVIINNAIQLPITPIMEETGKGKEFTNCRNYQFAYNYYGAKYLKHQTKLEI